MSKTLNTSHRCLCCLVYLWVFGCVLSLQAVAQVGPLPNRSTLLVLNPGHPHGAQLQQSLKASLQRDVYVYAPVNNDLESAYLNAIKRYNASDKTGSTWQVHTHVGEDYLAQMLANKKGDLVLIASNNKTKADYILKVASAGLSIIADKPMALTATDFDKLQTAFSEAQKHHRFVSDLPVMTMRNQIVYRLQKELVAIPEVFGALEKGSPEDPAIVEENRHYYDKGITRPTWFFDIKQQGSGVTDVTTHLADLILWTCFPESISYKKDVDLVSAKLWPTVITPEQFKKITQVDPYPDFLKPYQKGGQLEVFSNGEITSQIKGVYVRMRANWEVEPPAGGSDTYYSLIRGTRATLVIKPGNPKDLFIKPGPDVSMAELGKALHNEVDRLKKQYPFIALHKEAGGWRISSEQLTEKRESQITIPSQQEIDRMLAKYYITTQADAVAVEGTGQEEN